MGVAEAFLVLWALVAKVVRSASMIILVVSIVYIGLPMSATQDEFVDTAQTATAQAAVVWNFSSDLVNVYYRCTFPAREVRNRVVGFIYGTLQLLAEEILGIDFDVAPNLRGEDPRVLPNLDNLCDFAEGLGEFILNVIDLVSIPINFILEVLLIAIHDGVDAAALSILEEIQSLLEDELFDALDIGGCTRKLPWSIFYCFCPDFTGGRRWDSPDDVPQNVFKAALACVFPPYNPDTDSFDDVLNLIFSVPQLQAVAGVFQTVYNGLVTAFNFLQSTYFDAIAFFSRISGQVFGIDGEIANFINGALADFFKKLWKKFIKLFGRDVPAPQMETFAKTSTDVRRIYIWSLALQQAAREIAAHYARMLPPVQLSMIASNATERSATRTERDVRPRELHDLFSRKAREHTARYVRLKHPTGRGAAFVTMGRVLSDAIWSEKPLSAADIRARYRAHGFEARHVLSRSDTCTVCNRARLRNIASRFTNLFPRPENVVLAGKIILTLGGIAVGVVSIFILGVLFPPVFLFVVFAAIGPVVLLAIAGGSQIAFGRLDDLSNADVNNLPFVPTIVAAAQFIGNTYYNDGLISFDVAGFFGLIGPHIWADLWYASSVPVSFFIEALPIDLTMPVQQRGDTIGDIVLGSLLCIQNQTCTTVDDCRGRAVGCYDGGCMCFGYVRLQREIPRLEVQDDVNTRCSDYGYRYSDMLPYQTGGSLSWTNVRATFDSFVAGMRDILQHVAAREFMSPKILAVYIATLIPFLATSARVIGAYGTSILFAQEAFYWLMQGAKYVGADNISFLEPAFRAPEHGLTCVVLNLPAILLWLSGISIALIVLSTFGSFLIWLALVVWPPVRFVLRGIRQILFCGRL